MTELSFSGLGLAEQPAALSKASECWVCQDLLGLAKPKRSLHFKQPEAFTRAIQDKMMHDALLELRPNKKMAKVILNKHGLRACHNGGDCLDSGMNCCSAGHKGYFCTLDAGHLGAHHAGTTPKCAGWWD